MTERDDIAEEEKPLDPATERVRRKLVRFSAVFMGFNILALMAVLAALVYKLGGYGEEAVPAVAGSELPGAGFERELDLPEGANVVSASSSGGQVLLNLRLGDGRAELWFYDLGEGRVTGKVLLR